MALRYQKRVNLGGGTGLNVSKSGVSGSMRSSMGSVGTRGFSIRTGIPGLSYRGQWTKGKYGAIALLLVVVVTVGVLVLYNIIRLIAFLCQRGYHYIKKKMYHAPH